MSLKSLARRFVPRLGIALLAAGSLLAVPAAALGAAATRAPAASTARPAKAKATAKSAARHAPKKARTLPKRRDGAHAKPPARPAAQARSVSPAK